MAGLPCLPADWQMLAGPESWDAAIMYEVCTALIYPKNWYYDGVVLVDSSLGWRRHAD